MLSTQSAIALVLQHLADFGTETIPLAAAAGRVLAEPLLADRDFPPFDRVTMDGIAIRYDAFVNGRRTFLIEALQAAGAEQLTLKSAQNCLEVMTGAMLPQRTDTVIRYEDVKVDANIAIIQISDIIKRQNLHRRGSDRQQGDVILQPNQVLSPAEIGVAATVGKAQLQVKKLPRTILISTGDELVQVEESPLTHQIRSSNTWMLRAFLEKWKIQAEQIHLVDQQEFIMKKLKNCLNDFDLLLISGGVSEGKLDFVPNALQQLGVEKVFHKVQQRPGKPLWFGQVAGRATVFALPGNPVSALVGAVRYVEPWLQKSLGLETPEQFAILTEDVEFKFDLTYFLQVRIATDQRGQMLAKPVAGGGSGDLANLTTADGFLELPPGRDLYRKGEAFRFWNYRNALNY
jgi:molybdopterin molybdotransferase